MANFMKRFKNLINNPQKEDAPVQAEFVDFVPEISTQGDFKMKVDLDAILNSWMNILLTPTRTYIFDPEYGSDIYKYVFEPLDAMTASGIKRETINKIEMYDTRMPLKDASIKKLINDKGFAVEIIAEYESNRKSLTIPITQESILDLEIN